jgi:hypothetical protein
VVRPPKGTRDAGKNASWNGVYRVWTVFLAQSDLRSWRESGQRTRVRNFSFAGLSSPLDTDTDSTPRICPAARTWFSDTSEKSSLFMAVSGIGTGIARSRAYPSPAWISGCRSLRSQRRRLKRGTRAFPGVKTCSRVSTDRAENYLINLFKPIWNNEVGICYGFGKQLDQQLRVRKFLTRSPQ